MGLEEYQAAVEDIKTNGLDGKSQSDLKRIRMVLIAQHEVDLVHSSAGPFIAMVDREIGGRKSAALSWIGIGVAIVATIFAAIAAWPVLKPWFQASPPVDKDASFQSPQSRSKSTAPPIGRATNTFHPDKQ